MREYSSSTETVDPASWAQHPLDTSEQRHLRRCFSPPRCSDGRMGGGEGSPGGRRGRGAPAPAPSLGARALQVALPAQLGMDPEDLQRIRYAHRVFLTKLLLTDLATRPTGP